MSTAPESAFNENDIAKFKDFRNAHESGKYTYWECFEDFCPENCTPAVQEAYRRVIEATDAFDALLIAAIGPPQE